MNGIRAAYRAVKTPPPFCLGGPPVLFPPATDECEDEAPERPCVCPECNGAFETLRQLVAHQTHKHGYRHPPGIVTVTNTCVWCRNIHRDRRATYLHHQQSWTRGYCTGKGSHLHIVVAPVNTTCSHCDQHFDSVAMLLEHLRAAFPLDQKLQNWALTQTSGTPEARPQRTKRSGGPQGQPNPDTQKHMLLVLSPSCLEPRSGDPRAASGHLPHDACEARRTFGAGEQSGHRTSCDQIEGRTATSGRAARLWMGGHDDGHDHGPSTLGGRQA